MTRSVDIRMERVALVAAWGAAVIAVAATAYSYAQVKWVSEQLDPAWPWLSWLFPVIVDVPLLVFSLLSLALHDRRERLVRAYAWAGLLLFAGLSWLCNATHGLHYARLRDLAPGAWGTVLTLVVSALPTLGLVAGPHVAVVILRLSHPIGEDGEVVRQEPSESNHSTSRLDRLVGPAPLVEWSYTQPRSETPTPVSEEPVEVPVTVLSVPPVDSGQEAAYQVYAALREALADGEEPSYGALVAAAQERGMAVSRSTMARHRPKFSERYDMARLVERDTPVGAPELVPERTPA